MTPEESKPIEMVDENGEPTLWFTAKETAEMAHAYARAIAAESRTWVSADHGKHEAARAELMAWREKFEEWSK